MDHRTRIKFCGLTREQDVALACALGVDAVGFVCHPGSPRYVDPARLPDLAGAVAPFVMPVLLFVDAAEARIRQALERVPGALLQFHGHEDEAFCRRFARPYLRAVSMAQDGVLLHSEAVFHSAAGLLADAAGPGSGGAGETFDWGRVPAPDRRSLPLILAGGLHAENVAEAIRAVRPYAVDVSSGIEESRGIKSAVRMRNFVAAVRAADARIEHS